MTGSVTMWADFSISMEYCLPVRISQSVEYQSRRPRPPMLRVPMAATSSSLPALMWGSSASPGEGRASVLGFAFLSFLSFEPLAVASAVFAGVDVSGVVAVASVLSEGCGVCGGGVAAVLSEDCGGCGGVVA